MEIALTGLNTQFSDVRSVKSAEQRQQQARARQQAGDTRTRTSDNQTAQDARQASRQNASENVRVINGEVLASETTRVAAESSSRSLFSPAPSERQPPRGQADKRQIPIQQALQNFQQNEALLSPDNRPRQVSGIIDIYV